jgi:putative GTP pyrophosphokinase
MTEEDIRERYDKEKPFYDHLGDLVCNLIQSKCADIAKSRVSGSFFKIEPSYRTKTPDSLVAKALYRGKDYTNPYDDIEDKVGVRFVLLFQSDVNRVKGIVEELDDFTCERSRDYEEEKAENPTLFEYQSVHYIIQNRSDINTVHPSIPAGTPCEIQIRTLLQHAHSELTHDTTYKSDIDPPPGMLRAVAKSMALIETAGDMFEEVNEEIQAMHGQRNDILMHLARLYKSLLPTGHPIDNKMNFFFLEKLSPLINRFLIDNDGNLKYDKLARYYEEGRGAAVLSFIRKRLSKNVLYQQPVILVIFYLVEENQRRLKDMWPAPITDLQPIYTQLGKALPRS